MRSTGRLFLLVLKKSFELISSELNGAGLDNILDSHNLTAEPTGMITGTAVTAPLVQNSAYHQQESRPEIRSTVGFSLWMGLSALPCQRTAKKRAAQSRSNRLFSIGFPFFRHIRRFGRS